MRRNLIFLKPLCALLRIGMYVFNNGGYYMAFFIRIAIIVLVIYLFYKIVRYVFDPKRKLDEAHEKGEYYFYDDVKNVRKNFFITYKGAMFEGEKYLGTTERSFEVISILVTVHHNADLHGLTKDDFLFLENEIAMSYPAAKISWTRPIEDLLNK